MNFPFAGSAAAVPSRWVSSPNHSGFRRKALFLLIPLGALLVVALPPLYSLGAIFGIGALLFFLAQPFVGLLALAFCVPFESVYNLHAGGLNVTVTNFVVFCVAFAWLSRGIAMGKLETGVMPWRPALLLYGGVLILSVTQATNYVGSAKELLKWGQMLVVYMAACSMVRTRRDLRILLAVLFVAVIAESSVGVLQVIRHSGPSSFARGALLRGSGTFDQPNPFAGYLNMVLPLAVAFLVFRVFPRRAMWFVALVTAAGVLGSLSRGGEIGSAAALITIAAFTSKLTKPFLLLGAVVLATAIAAAVVGAVPSTYSDAVLQGFGIANIDVSNPSPETWNVAERLAHMEAGLHMFADHPFLGVGIGNYPAQYANYRVAPVWGPDLGHAHNFYINIAAEAGAIGFAAYLFLIGSAMYICIQAYRRAPDALGRAISLGGLAILVGYSFHQFFDNLFVHGMEVQLALIMAAVTRAGYASADELDPPPAGDAEPARPA